MNRFNDLNLNVFFNHLFLQDNPEIQTDLNKIKKISAATKREVKLNNEFANNTSTCTTGIVQISCNVLPSIMYNYNNHFPLMSKS